MNRPLKPRPAAANKPTREALAAALAEKERALAEALARQAATTEVLRVISRSSADAQPVFESIALAAMRLLHCDVAGLFGCDEFAYWTIAGANPQGLVTLPGPSRVLIDPAASFPSQAIVSRQVLHVPDWSRVELPEVERRVQEQAGLNSTLYLPMLREDRCVGLLVFGSSQSNNFGPSEIALAESFRDQASIAIENTRLFNEAESRTRDLEESLQQQTATADVLKVISRSVFDVQAVLDTLVESAARLCGAGLGLLYLAGDDAFECKALAGMGTAEAAQIFKGRPIRAGRGTAAERVIMTGEVQCVEDFFADLEFDPRIRAALRAAAETGSGLANLRSTLAVPMKRRDSVVGVIAIARAQTGPFPQRQVELLQTFADQAVIAIENARLFAEVEAKTRDLSEALVYQTGSGNILKVIAASPTDVAPVLRAIVDSACEVCDAYDAAVLLKKGDDLKFSAHRGPIPIGLEGWPISRRWVGGRAFVDQKPVHVHDLMEAGEEFPDGRDLARRMGHRTILAVPLIREGESIGAIVVRRNEIHPFTDKQIALLQTFADQAVIAIGNVHLFDEVQARTRELTEALERQEASANILRVISGSPTDVKPVFEAIVLTAARLFDCNIAGVFRVEGDRLTVVTGAWSDRLFLEQEHSPPLPIDPAANFPSRAVVEKKTVFVADYSSSDAPEHERWVQKRYGVESGLYLPLMRGGECIGVFLLTASKAGAFGEKEIALAESFRDQAQIAIENTRLFRETQEALEQQTATADVLKIISQSVSDAAPVFETILESCQRLFALHGVAIYLVEGEMVRGVARRGFDLGDWGADVMPLAGSSTGEAIAERRPLHIPNLAERPGFPESKKAALKEIGGMSVLYAPMLSQDRGVGSIVVTRRPKKPFTEAEIEFIQTFADQAVIAIENARLLEEVRARTSDLEESLAQQTATADVLKVISRSVFDLETVLQTLIDTAVRLGRGSRGTIFIRRGDVLVASAFHRNVPSELRAFLATTPWRIDGDSDMARAVRERKVVHIPDLSTKRDAITSEVRNRAAFGAALWVPLMRDGEAIGLFGVPRDEPIAFTDREIEIVKTFADQAVIAIENARLFEEVQARTRDLSEALQQQTATADVLKVISRSAFGLRTVLQTLVDSAVRLCAADGVIYLKHGDLFLAEASFDADASGLALKRMPRRPGRDSVTGRVALSGRIEQIPDNLADPEFMVPSDQRMKMRSLLGVPLLHDGEVEGVFVLGRPEPGPFSERAIELVRTFADQAVIAIQNVRLFDAVQAKTHDLSVALERQTATSEILRVISQSPTDARPVFESIVVTAARLLHCDLAFVMLSDGKIWWNAAVASPEGLLPVLVAGEFPVDPAASFPARAILDRAMLYLPDWSLIEVPEHQRLVQTTYGINASLHLPLLRDGACIGLITLTCRRANPFGPSDIEQAESFRDQALIAIENARMFDEVQARTRELSEALQQQTATADVLKVISRSAFDLQTVLDTLVASAAKLCEAEKACIFQRQGDLYHWVSNFGFSNELVAYAGSHPFREGANSTTSRVARDRRTVHIPDVLADPDYAASEYQRLGRYRTMLGVPLLREGAPIGVFIMTREAVRPFNDRQIDLLQTFADQAVIAIENVRLFDEVQARTRELAASLDDLRKAQDRLVQSEKLASLGQLTAGIAHEIKNPLNFINNFSGLSRELLGELGDALKNAPLEVALRDEVDDLIATVGSNLDKVVSHGKRADSIVKNMLLHSREGSGERANVNVNAMVEEALNLAYHGARAEKPGFNVTIVKSLDPAAGAADLYAQEMTRVLLNLISNGFYATTKRKQGETDASYEPTITAATRDLGDSVEIVIRDNGTGIPEDVKAKMFNPFFTTKPAGEGTGLGLSLSHDIVVKQHGGTLEVSTEPGAFTQFTIVVPRATGANSWAR